MSAAGDPRRGLLAWLGERLPIATARDFAMHKTVPVHRYGLLLPRRMTLFFFLVQVFTGILLMLYYRPSADEAFESVEFIMTTVPFGWLMRSVHSWSANLMVFFALVHLATVYFVKAYRKPREVTWITGVLLLFLLLGFGFSGYLLPWNQLAFFATKVGTDIAGAVPWIGEWLVRFLRGGERVTGGTLSRFYGWHVAILPAATTLLLGLHLLLVQVQGMSEPPWLRRRGAEKPPADEVLPALRPARPVRLDRRPRRARGAGRPVPLGAGREGRSLRAGLRRHQARVVLHVHVRDPQAGARRRGRWASSTRPSPSCCSARGPGAAADPLPRPREGARATPAGRWWASSECSTWWG
jgi:hypothetical protein